MNPLSEVWLRERPEAPALVFGDRTWSWAELDVSSRGVGAALQARGLGSGDRVAVLASNTPGFAFLVHAAVRTGVELVLLNTRLTEADWREQLSRTRCRALALGRGLSLESPGVPVLALDELHADPSPCRDVDPDPARPLALLFTSGTTGRPKAAVLSIGALRAHARASGQHLGQTLDDLHLCNLPLFHVGGLSMLFRAAACGGAVLLHERFDAERVLADLASRPVTHLSLVSTTLARLLDALGDAPFPLQTLRVALLGGGPLPAPLRARAREKRLPLRHTYGLTEACSQVTTESEIGDGETAGVPLPGVEVRIVDGERRELPVGQAGEIEVKGPGLMLGYDGDAEATGAALDDGWLRTRDLGTLDAQGRLVVHARRTDLILSGGENVYPAEIEAALLGVPGVRDAAVLGRADQTWGQVPIAAVVLAGDATVAAVAEALNALLPRFKRPRELLALPELPRNAAGKVERAKLRALLGLGNDS
ncbi:MAG: o-succinylbenzoate--CoA ligase [Deltaproteobacteria bacterium]|nr:o-succinylbenzoate--CoA ligase [Deltaproteobacteria bacterium]